MRVSANGWLSREDGLICKAVQEKKGNGDKLEAFTDYRRMFEKPRQEARCGFIATRHLLGLVSRPMNRMLPACVSRITNRKG